MINFLESSFSEIHWPYKVAGIALFIIIFNVCSSTFLQRLHRRFEARGSIWRASFFGALSKPLAIYIWFFFIMYTLHLLNIHLNNSSTFEQLATESLTIGAIIASAWFAFRWKRQTLTAMTTNNYWEKGGLDKGHLDALDKLITLLISFIFLVWLLEAMGQGIGVLLTLGGVGAAAIGFASKEFIANFFGGFMIYLNKPFKIGDAIKLVSKDTSGVVEEIGWYMTRIRDFEKQLIFIPNSMFSQFIVINMTKRSHRVIKETVGIRYSDFGCVKNILNEIRTYLLEHPDLDHTLNQWANFSEYGDSSLNLTFSSFTYKTSLMDYYLLKEEVLFKVFEIVQKHGADFAFKTITVESTPK